MTAINDLVEILHREDCSCVILTAGGDTIICRGRGVSDLLNLLLNEPGSLRGALVADKVVGKGAAVLMILGGVTRVHADLMSLPARDLLEASSVPFSSSSLVPGIINRAGTGPCPVESLCLPFKTPGECLPVIKNFYNII